MLVYLIILSLSSYIYASETPIIGVLSQEAYLVNKAYPDADSFIVASYIKILEANGARVVPIWIGQSPEYYERVVNYTNGILFPGGGTYFNETGGYGEAAKQLYDLATKANERGVYYPLWGICLGMQVLMYGALGVDIRGDCNAKNVSLPLEFVDDFKQSKLFANAPSTLIEALKTENITYNYHRYCLFEQDLKKYNILNNWKILSKNKDIDGVEFVSTMEHNTLPFFGTQYHPEKNAFEFKKSYQVSHSEKALEFTQYIGNYFVQESRKNNQSFPSSATEFNSLIYNFNPVYSASNTSYEQLYLFKQEEVSGKLLL